MKAKRLRRTGRLPVPTSVARHPSAAGARREHGSERRGTALIVVASLLGLLVLLGFMIISTSSQEQASATYFAASAKQATATDIDPEAYLDFCLRQLILGAGQYHNNSMFWGGRNSLLPTMFGRDVHPYANSGVHPTTQITYPATGAGIAVVDQDHNGIDDGAGPLDWLALHHGPASRNGLTNALAGANFPSPGADYTAPDINSPFLAHVGYTIDDQGRSTFVVLPSFHRPQYLRVPGGAGLPPVPIRDADTNPSTVTNVLRAHAEHDYVYTNPTTGAVSVLGKRYIRPTDPLPVGATGPFPFGWANQGVWNMRIWTQNTAYAVADWVVPTTSNGLYYRCKTAGNSANIEPSPWPTTPGNTLVEAGGAEWECFAHPVYEFDADPDRDGIKEAVWLDLGHPPQQLPTGERFVPMFAITVYDADALLNLNVHGNASGDVNLDVPANPFGNGSFVSRSNEGLSPTEINPQYALNSDPVGDLRVGDTAAVVFEDPRTFFGHDPANVVELSNMEYFYWKFGRYNFSAATIVGQNAGVWGELTRLGTAYGTKDRRDLPQPGWAAAYDGSGNVTNSAVSDDNGNNGYGDATSPIPFVRPLDWRGVGTNLDATRRVPLFFPNPAVGVNRWRQYVDYPTRGNVLWGNYQGGNLMVLHAAPPAPAALPPEFVGWSLVDEPWEVEFDTRVSDAGRDSRFDASENLFLNAPDSQVTALGLAPRIRELLNFNVWKSQRGPEIRRRFATESWDVKSRGAQWAGPPTGGPVDALRRHEFEALGANSFGEVQYRFPVDRGANDPIRPELREWLETVINDSASAPSIHRQRLLDPNRVLEDGTSPSVARALTDHVDAGTAVLPATGVQTDYTPTQWQEWLARRDRQLMARDVYVLLYLYGGGENKDYSTSNADNGADNRNLPQVRQGDRLRILYDDWQLRQMAQFAINVVNALDRDDVLDAFEYDRDLSDGWNVDDNPYSVDVGLPVPADRGVVYGVEHQTLTFSEALVARLKQYQKMGTPTDHQVTQWNDLVDRFYSFIELRNAAPHPVSFDGDWQIELVTDDDPDGPGPMPAVNTWTRRLTLMSDDPNFGPTGTPAAAIPGGGLFQILTASDNSNVDPMTGTPRPSHVMLDLNYPANMPTPMYTDRMVPRSTAERQVDLIVDGGTRFRLEDQAGTALGVGGLITATNIGTIVNGGTGTIRMTLRRRADINRAIPPAFNVAYDADNPWVEVDSYVIGNNSRKGYGEIEILKDDTDPTVIDEIRQQFNDNLQSRERAEPLARQDAAGMFDRERAFPKAGAPLDNTNIKQNSIGLDNQATANKFGVGQPFPTWQPQWDRDFASAVELLGVPLYDPEDALLRLDKAGTWAAQRKFLKPLADGAYGPDGLPGTVGTDDDGNTLVDDEAERGMGDDPDILLPGNEIYGAKYDNRWHRLFGLVEVPTRIGPDSRFRVPGKLQLNTLRHPEVFAGLIDDAGAFLPNNFQPSNPSALPKQASYVPDSFPEGPRDWWVQFLLARDGIDPLTNVVLPGMPHSRPFRSLDHVGHGVSSLEHTLLRSLPLDQRDPITGDPVAGLNPDEIRRRLFELGDRNGRYGPDLVDLADGNAVDHVTRHRLLSKLQGLTTTRSNVFVVFVEVAYFEVVDDPTPPASATTPAQRIGAQLAVLPSNRGFYVIDRSRAVETLKPADFRGTAGATDPARFSLKWDSEGGFDHKNVIVYSRLLE